MKRAYIITNFDFKTDVTMSYKLKTRDIFYSEDDMLYYIKDILESIHNDYQDITNKVISYDDFYSKFKLKLKVSIISLNRKYCITEEEYNKYLKDIKIFSKDELYDYLIDNVPVIELNYDYKLNIKETLSNVINDDAEIFNEYYKQPSFSYKALFPEKYHVDKYNVGDEVLYDGDKYIIYEIIHPDKSIYESDDPLNYLYGYILYDKENEWYIPDDRFGYYPVDEDLELIK